MRALITFVLLVFSIAVYAKPGDTTPLPPSRIYRVQLEQSMTSKGKQKTEIIVIYYDSLGFKRMAYMTKSDYDKLKRAEKYGVHVEYVLVEMSNQKMKVSVK